MTMTRKGWVIPAAAVVAILLASPVGAQGTSDDSADAARVAKAESLEREAAGLADQRHQWDYAAALYRAAAKLRGDDEAAVRDLLQAGRLAYYRGDHEAAVTDLRAAAETAFATGSEGYAAHLFLDAAWVADRAGKGKLYRSLGLRATEIARDGNISPSERRAIFQRFEGEPAMKVAFLGRPQG